MAERASASGDVVACRFGFDSESGQTNDFKIGIHSFPGRAAWVKLNRLRSGIGRFCSSIYKWGLAPLTKCECCASEQTADHIIL